MEKFAETSVGCEKSTVSIEKLDMLGVLNNLSSALTIDAAPNHTGVVYWDGTEIHEYYFKLKTPDKSNPYWGYLLRREFKEKLKAIVDGKHFEAVMIEGVYGGENFDTTFQLLSINSVIDELLFDRVCFTERFYRWNSSEWMSKARKLYKQKGMLKTKIEIQGILEYLGYSYYLEHKDLPEKPAKAKKEGVQSKEEICFEDICDAAGMLLALVVHKNMETNIAKSIGLRMSDIKIVFVEDPVDVLEYKDKRFSEETSIVVDLDLRNLESSILAEMSASPDDVLCALVPVEKLGTFGMKRGFEFYQSGQGYLFFYNKKAKK